MELRTKLWIGCVSAVLAATPVRAAALTVRECVAAKPTPASYTWDFKGEANTIFSDLEFTADQAFSHAEYLQNLATNQDISWQVQANQLQYLKDEINGIGTRLCRLETIRSVVAPWQQKEIDRVATTARQMAINAEGAIRFVNANQNGLWLPTYQTYVKNLYGEAESLKRSFGNAVEFGSVSKEYHDLQQRVGS